MTPQDQEAVAVDEAATDDPAAGDDALAPEPDDELAAVEEAVESDIAEVADVAQSTADDLERQRNEYLALAQRLQAEFENYKKQTIRRNTEVVEHASASLAEKLLPVLDACDNAVIHGVEGIGPIFKALFETLAKEGLEVIETEDAPFDPNEHEAVLHEPAGDEEPVRPTVADTLRTGYRWKGRVLRPALVKVRG